MLRSLWSAASGMLAQQLNVDTIANNLANVNTPGFKKSRVHFQDLFYQQLREPGATSVMGVPLPLGLEVGHGTRPVATERIFTMGSLQLTDHPFDLAIEGDGFFMIDRGDGTIAYTRDGSFRVDADGFLTTSGGYYVLTSDFGYIQVPEGATDFSVSSDGTVTVVEAGADEPTEIGQIGLTVFTNPAGLASIGQNMFAETPVSGFAFEAVAGQDGAGYIVQQTLEMSNVSVVEEMIALIVAQRAYEINTKAVQSSDEMLAQANNLRR